MKIVLVSGLQIFPAESGGQMRTAQLASCLAKAGNQVFIYSWTGRKKDYLSLLSSSRTSVSSASAPVEEFVNRNLFWGILQFLSYRFSLPPFWLTLVSFLWTPKILKKWIRECDAIMVDFPYLYPLLQKCSSDKKTYLNTHNREFACWSHPGISSLVKKIELRAMNSAQQVIFCSEEDRQFFLPFDPARERDFFLVSNGVGPLRFQGKGGLSRESLSLSKETKIILYSASRYGPNLEGMEFLKAFMQEHPAFLRKFKILFLVVGTVMSRPVREDFLLATSWVEDIGPYFSLADWAINPVFSGSGTSLKMREYLAAKLPTFTTDFGARGLNLKDREDSYFFSKENLKKALEEALTKPAEDIQKMAEGAFHKNRSEIDMEWSFKESGIRW